MHFLLHHYVFGCRDFNYACWVWVIPISCCTVCPITLNSQTLTRQIVWNFDAFMSWSSKPSTIAHEFQRRRLNLSRTLDVYSAKSKCLEAFLCIVLDNAFGLSAVEDVEMVEVSDTLKLYKSMFYKKFGCLIFKHSCHFVCVHFEMCYQVRGHALSPELVMERL